MAPRPMRATSRSPSVMCFIGSTVRLDDAECEGRSLPARDGGPAVAPARSPELPLTYAGKHLHNLVVTEETREIDSVFKALADPTRRMLLDRLRDHNGQTLSELCDPLDMKRQSATQHLDVLVKAN